MIEDFWRQAPSRFHCLGQQQNLRNKNYGSRAIKHRQLSPLHQDHLQERSIQLKCVIHDALSQLSETSWDRNKNKDWDHYKTCWKILDREKAKAGQTACHFWFSQSTLNGQLWNLSDLLEHRLRSLRFFDSLFNVIESKTKQKSYLALLFFGFH